MFVNTNCVHGTVTYKYIFQDCRHQTVKTPSGQPPYLENPLFSFLEMLRYKK